MKPVLFLTGHVAADRHGAFAALHDRVGLELGLYGGRHLHLAPSAQAPAGVPHRHIAQREVSGLIASGAYRAVIAGSGGRVALPLAWRAATRRQVPFIFWSALWQTPHTVAHLAALPLMRAIHRNAAAVVTYGTHVSEHAAALGATRIFIAPQAVDNAFWSATPAPRTDQRFAALFVGRPARAKGLAVLLAAWRESGLGSADAILTVVGPHRDLPEWVHAAGEVSPSALRNFYGACDVLTVPSIRTRQFIEPWGLVVNEAMNQQSAIIASDAVGAAAGGLVRHERNGLIVPSGDSRALALGLRALADDRAGAARLGANGRSDVARLTHEAWADGFVQALAAAETAAAAGSVNG